MSKTNTNGIINITVETPAYQPKVYGLSHITPELFDTLDREGCGVIVCPDGDMSRPYLVTWVDKGCDEDGVYYKGCVQKLTTAAKAGFFHYEGVWFNRKNFREVVGEFIAQGGDLVTPLYVAGCGHFQSEFRRRHGAALSRYVA